MSIKRSRQPSYGKPRRDEPATFRSAPSPEPEKSWAERLAGQPDDAFAPYALTGRFAKDALIAHPTFGRGVVLNVSGTRIEVLFEAGRKHLAHAGPR